MSIYILFNLYKNNFTDSKHTVLSVNEYTPFEK